MPTMPVYDMDGSQVGEIDLNDSIFSVKVNEPLLHQAVVRQNAAKRQGTAKAKTRSEVRGGGRKPWRQKGTGRARHGSRRSPLWAGGGVIFPPLPRDYGFQMPKKARRLALCSALSAKVNSGALKVLDTLSFEQPKTKSMIEVLDKLEVSEGKSLIVQADVEENVVKSARNIPGVATLSAESLNVYDILTHDYLVLTRDAVGRIEEALG